MTLCTELSVVNYDGSHAHAVSLRCNRWECDHCQPFKVRELRWLARTGEPATFITLTANPATGIDANDRARNLVHAWQLIAKRLKRKLHVTSFPYLYVIEATQAGEPHMHILTRVRWIDHQWLSDAMRELTDAPVVHIERIRSQSMVGGYVAKYVGKGPAKFEGCKRFAQSRSWLSVAAKLERAERRNHGKWWVCNHSLHTTATRLWHEGYEIEWLSPHEVIGHWTSGVQDVEASTGFLAWLVRDWKAKNPAQATAECV